MILSLEFKKNLKSFKMFYKNGLGVFLIDVPQGPKLF